MRFLLPITLTFVAGTFAQAPVGPGVPRTPPIAQPVPVGPGIPRDATAERVAALSTTQLEFFGAVLKYSEKPSKSSLALTKSTALDLFDPTKQMPVGPGVPKAEPKPRPKPKSSPATPQELILRLNRADADTQTALQGFLTVLATTPTDNDAAIRTMVPKTSGDLKATLGSVLKQEKK